MHPAQDKWNQRYQEQGPERFGDQASEWLLQHESLLQTQPKGRALDIASGNGRNAFYLAEMGFEVDAVDISDVAIQWVKSQAQQRDLPVQSFHLNLEAEAFPHNNYQLIACFNYLQRDLFPKIIDALAPDGVLFYETKYLDHIKVLDGSMNPEYVLDYNELLQAFSQLRILHYEERIRSVGPSQRRKALASLVAMNSRITH